MNDTLLPVNYYQEDTTFDSMFPYRIQKLSKIHWTPIQVAKKAASFLASSPGTKVLDIGSGVGKFCLAGASYFPDVEFYGVEQRKDLVDVANISKNLRKVTNVHFMHGNFTQINFDIYENIYFYNSFCENLIDQTFDNLSDLAHIDNSLEYSDGLYTYYSTYLYSVLEGKAPGTRLVTFHDLGDQVPFSYDLVGHAFDKLLKMWIKR